MQQKLSICEKIHIAAYRQVISRYAVQNPLLGKEAEKQSCLAPETGFGHFLHSPGFQRENVLGEIVILLTSSQKPPELENNRRPHPTKESVGQPWPASVSPADPFLPHTPIPGSLACLGADAPGPGRRHPMTEGGEEDKSELEAEASTASKASDRSMQGVDWRDFPAPSHTWAPIPAGRGS